MDRDEAIKLLWRGPEGVNEWNRWRESREPMPDLSAVNLFKAILTGANLSEVNLSGATLIGAILDGANLSEAKLVGTNLSGTRVRTANFHRARCSLTAFANIDLSETKELESILHLGPSTVGIDTLFRSRGRIPEAFLRGCGVPESVIINRFALIGAIEPIQFYSCFISYSSKDEEFARRLHGRMRDEKLRVWCAPEDIKGGRKILDQVETAIHV
jgi:hypothetical protein